MIQKVKEIISKYAILRNKFFLTFVFFLIWMGFIDTNSWLYQMELDREKKTVIRSIHRYKKEIEKDKKQIEELNTMDGLEKIAREEYWMKRDNEDLFIIEIK